MKIAVIDTRASEDIERGLLLRGFKVLRAPGAKNLPEPLSSHPDMLMIKIGNTLLSSCEYAEEASWLFEDLNLYTGMHFSLTSDTFSPTYPHDAIFNALVLGRRIFCKSDSVSRGLLSLAEAFGLRVIHTNQGYPACTVLPLGDGAAITADYGMAKILSGEGIEVTLINNGGISLPPYEYGFIGGSAGVYGKTVYFLGDPLTHPDGEKILRAIERAGLNAAALSSSPLSDLGRIIFAD